MKSTLKVPGTKRLKLKYGDALLSSVAFNFNLRRYIVEVLNPATQELVCLVRPHLLSDVARHVIGANPTQETRVYNDMDD